MPYTVKKGKGGFKACKKGGKKCFSKKPLTKKQAVKQIGAIASKEKVKKESFDEMINQYLNHYLFEDVMASPTQPAKPNDPQAQNLKKNRADKLKELQTKLNKPPTQQEVDAFAAGQQSVK